MGREIWQYLSQELLEVSRLGMASWDIKSHLSNSYEGLGIGFSGQYFAPSQFHPGNVLQFP